MSDAMRRRLQRSDYIFSGFKTFHELNEAFPSLIDENGNRKPFERFLNDVRKIDATYNRNYLRAEYNFASASAEMAARWEQFMEDGDRYNLQYRTAGDERVRPEHIALHGVTLPIDDPFWEEFYPPNGWNCRCEAVQVRKSKYPVTPHDEAMALGEQATQRDTRQMFRFNPGKEQQTFPDYNPYTISKCKTCKLAQNKFAKGIADNDLCAACDKVRLMAKIKQNRELYQQLLNDPDYKDVEFNPETGGLKATHIGHNTQTDDKVETFFGNMKPADLERECQNLLVRWGHRAILRDEFANKKLSHTPPSLDIEIDGKIMDIRSITQNGLLGNPLMAKNKQLGNVKKKTGIISDCVCLHFHDATMFSEKKLLQGVEWFKNRIQAVGGTQRIKHIYVVVNGGCRLLTYDI